mgnify:CR=1 FL=1
MPVLIISTYNEDGSVDCMNAAWSTMEDNDVILLELSKEHQTSENILREKAFCVSVCDKKNVVQGDFVGIVSNKTDKNKFKKTKWTEKRSENVSAPIIEELPLCLECKLDHIREEDGEFAVYGKIVSVSVNEDILDEKGKIDLKKAQFLTFLPFDNSYHTISEKVANAFLDGLKLR